MSTVRVRTASGPFVYRDEYVHDVQTDEAFRETRNGWRAEYDAELDVWHVQTPYGQYREYRRI